MTESRPKLAVATSLPREKLEAGCSLRLSTLQLYELTRDAVIHEIEVEAARILGLEEPRFVRESDEGYATSAEFETVIPVRNGSIVSKTRIRPGMDEEAQAFASQVSTILRIHEKFVDQERRKTELVALYEISRRLVASLDVEIVLQRIVEHAQMLLSMDLAWIALLHPDEETLHMKVAVGHKTPEFLDIVLPVDRGIGGWVVRTRQAAHSVDYLNDARFRHSLHVDEVIRKEGLHSILGTPLRGRTSMLGVLFVAKSTLRRFAEYEIQLLGNLGDLAAVAFENANLFEAAVRSEATARSAQQRAEDHLRELVKADRLHKSLTEVVLVGEGVPGVALRLADEFHIGIAIVNHQYEILAETDFDQDLITDARLAPTFLSRHETSEALRAVRSRQDSQFIDGTLLITPIIAHGELLGLVFANGGLDEVGKESLKTALEQAARVVALELLRDRATTETERRLRIGFVHELLGDFPIDPEMLRWRAQRVWRGYDQPHRPIVISLSDIVDGNIDCSINDLEHAREVIGRHWPSNLVATYRKRLVCLVTAKDRAGTSQMLKSMRELLASTGFGATFVVGGECHGFEESRQSLSACVRLSELAEAGTTLWLEGIEILGNLIHPSNAGRLEEFVDATLAPLKGKRELVETLAAWYRSGCNQALAARSLHVHVNTFRYRMRRIEESLGTEISDPVRGVSLQLALLLSGDL